VSQTVFKLFVCLLNMGFCLLGQFAFDELPNDFDPTGFGEENN